jgi:putative ABC transport system permease protein
MFDRDKWLEIYQVLSKNAFRTTATAFGVFWGIFMLIIMLGAGQGLEKGATADFMYRATNSAAIWTRSTTKAHGGFKAGRRFEMNNSDIDFLRENVEDLDILCPRNQLGGYRGSNNVIRGTKTGAFSIYGDYPDYIKIEPRPITRGRFINDRDIEERRKICVIGERVYDIMFEKGEEPIGKYISINGVAFMVVGTYASMQKGERAEEDTQTIFVPFTTFQKAFNYGDVIGWLSVTAKPGVLASDLETKIKEALKSRHKVHPDDDRAFGSWNMEKEFLRLSSVFGGIRSMSWFVGVLTLFAGIIGVSNIMLVIIKERTNEFGVRRAVGATPANVRTQIILEAIILTSVAGFLGIIAGVWSLEGVNALIESQGNTGSFRNPGVDFNIVMIALAVLIFSGALAGVLPANRALNVKTIEALRAE